MKTISVIRRENHLKLEEKYGGLGQLNEKIGRDRSDSTLRQIRSRVRLKNGYSREMGDAVARELEEKLQLEIGWMDHSHGGTEEEEAARRSLTVLPIKRGSHTWMICFLSPIKRRIPARSISLSPGSAKRG